MHMMSIPFRVSLAQHHVMDHWKSNADKSVIQLNEHGKYAH